MTKKATPLMQQYNSIKQKYPDTMLLFRVGDFYETFGEDAHISSKVLDIVLTKRSNGSASEVALAGFPHHALDNYLPRLVHAGYRVAVCDQLEDPKATKGIVKRGVTELVTPGLSFHDQVLAGNRNNYLAAILEGKKQVGIAFLDISTGEFSCTNTSKLGANKLLQSYEPKELLYCKNQKNAIQYYQLPKSINYLDEWAFGYDFAIEKLTTHFQSKNLKGFGIDNLREGICCAGAILQYLEDTVHLQIGHINAISRISEEKYMWLDAFTVRNLELIHAQHQDGVSLLQVLDHTLTPMGARMLKKWIVLPLIELKEITKRQEMVQAFMEHPELMQFMQEVLAKMPDLERLTAKLAAKRINPKECNALKDAVNLIHQVRQKLDSEAEDKLASLNNIWRDCGPLSEKLEDWLKPGAGMLVNLGQIIQDGVDEELDELRTIAFSTKDILAKWQQKAIDESGITSLKIGFNKVFGYYLEVTHAHKDKVPEHWIRKQTLVNAERYITEELKEFEEKILHAESQIIQIEQKLYTELIDFAQAFIEPLQKNAQLIAKLDCLINFASLAGRHQYVKPMLTAKRELEIVEGRHPVIEQQMAAGSSYIPNSIRLNESDQQIILITGPNMAGKSALLRQTALIVLMAQMGSFVPVERAKIGLVDRIFTRVGASDNIARGESTFMVEMSEMASILHNLSARSLLLLDEIGRGTSTYDGISIAWSILEYLSSHAHHPKTLFATHYHELDQLSTSLKGVVSKHVSVKEVDGKMIFLRKLRDGGSAHSFGINVAKLAGMPKQVTHRAEEVLKKLEQEKQQLPKKKKKEAVTPQNEFQLQLFEPLPTHQKLVSEVEEMDIDQLTPLEALNKLHEIKKQLKE